MARVTRFVGMDAHAETIAVAVAEGRNTVRSIGTIPNRPEAVRKLMAKLGEPGTLRVCYEAGPTGYVLYWQLTRLGVHCDVIAPSLVPKMAGDHIKTDRRDAEKLACSYRSGDLSAVWVPDAQHESLRDLVRAREAVKEDELRAKHRLTKSLLRYLKAIVDALQSLRGVAKLTATTLATEFGTFRRFERAGAVMSYTGLVPSEHSSGAKSRRGKITKSGNSHLRRVLVESAGHCRTSTASLPSAAPAPAVSPTQGRRNRVASTGASAPPLLAAFQQEQAHRQGRHGAGTRARRFHLGHRHRDGERGVQLPATN